MRGNNKVSDDGITIHMDFIFFYLNCEPFKNNSHIHINSFVLDDIITNVGSMTSLKMLVLSLDNVHNDDIIYTDTFCNHAINLILILLPKGLSFFS